MSACTTALLLSMPAAAQESDETETATMDTVVVTGTNIRGTEVVGSATQTITAADLAESGKTGVGDFLREIPSNLAGGVGMSDETQSGQDAGPNAANLASGQGVNLRGLGALSTLVLVNGRRVPASGQFGDFVDVSNIPGVAISNIEILQDGASAVYGSDAVGGVVNFILKTEADRPVTTVKAGVATQGGGEEYLISHLQPFNWNSGNLVVAGEYYSRGAVSLTDRDPYSNGSDFSSMGGVNWPLYSGRVGPVANIYLSGGAAPDGTVGATVPNGSNEALTGADLIASTDGTGSTANPYEGIDILPELERFSLYVAGEQDLGSSMQLFGDARYTKRETSSTIGYYHPEGYNIASDSPNWIDGIDPSMISVDARSGALSIPFSVIIDEMPMSRQTEVESYSATIGLRADLIKDWVLETALTYSMEDQNRVERQPKGAGFGTSSSNPDTIYCALNPTTGACATAGVTPWNPWSTEGLSDAQLDEYFGVEDLTFESEVFQASAKIDGSLFSLPAGDVKFAVGGDYRNEGMEGFLYADTIYLAASTGPYTRTERDAISVFTEFLVPVHEMLDVSLAGRYESFEADYGSEYDDFNPKVGFNFYPVEGLTLKGSWGTSFHAPPMRFENADPQPLPGGNAAFTLPGSYKGPCESTLVDFNPLSDTGTPGVAGGTCTFTLIVNSGGAGPGVLKPEEAETFTLGVEYEPEAMPGLKFGLNYFNIEIDDRIQRIQSGTLPGILAEFFATDGGGAFISALNVKPTEEEAAALQNDPKYLGVFGNPAFGSADQVQMIVNATQINIASLKESGFDFNASYDWEAGGYDLGVFVYGTYLTEYKTQAAPGLDYIDQLGVYSSFGAPVELRSKQGFSVANDSWESVFTLNYVDEYECSVGCYVPDATTGAPVLADTPVPIDSWVTLDVAFNLDLEALLGDSMSGTSLSLNVNNLFDEDPPFLDGGSASDDYQPSAYDPNNHTIIGRTVGLTLTKEW